jgi:hypothetical protein
VVDLGNDTTLCQGESLALNAAVPGGSYLWNDGVTTASRNITSAGNFAVTVTAQGCSSSDQINVTVNPVPVVDLGPDVVVCPGATATFDATVPGGTYLWNTGSTAASITMGTPGTYSVQVTVGGCSASDAVVLSNFSLQSANLGPDLSICAGQSQQIGLDIPGATYLWNTGATSDSIAVSTAGSVWGARHAERLHRQRYAQHFRDPVARGFAWAGSTNLPRNECFSRCHDNRCRRVPLEYRGYFANNFRRLGHMASYGDTGRLLGDRRRHHFRIARTHRGSWAGHHPLQRQHHHAFRSHARCHFPVERRFLRSHPFRCNSRNILGGSGPERLLGP